MHELAVAQSIVEVVTAQASASGAARVTSVRLRIGEANSIVEDSLAFCFELLTSEDDLLAGARLEIEPVPHRAWCPRCEAEFAVVTFVAQCPSCGDWSREIRSGTEFQIAEIEIETADDAVSEARRGP